MLIKKASASQLRLVYNTLAETLPNFFRQTHCFDLYSDDVILEDNIRNIRTVGIAAYKQHVALVKLYSSVKYRNVELDLLKMTEHTEEGCVKVRWRIVGEPNWTILLNYLNYIPQIKAKTSPKDEFDVWIDGFSIFYVSGDGKIYKHTCDKLIPDDSYEKDDGAKRLISAFGGKLATFSIPSKRPRPLALCY